MTAQEKLARRISRDSICRAIQKKIDAGTADFSDTARYNDRAAELLGEVLAEYVPDMPPEARETLCKGLLRQRYLDTNAMLNAVQRTLDAAQGLHLAPQTADYPEERVEQAAHSLADETVPMETIQRRAKSAPATIARSFQDDYIEENAAFRDSAGLKCYINRIAAGGCCKWCTAMAGRYRYGEEPQDVYRRHDNCSCTVTYESGRQRQDVWSKRAWEVPGKDAGAGEPAVFSQEQAREIEANNSLTKGEKHGIMNIRLDDIKAAVTGSPITEEVAEYIFGVLAEQRNQFKFDGVKVVDIDSKIVMQTDPVQNGTFYDIVLNLNSAFLGGKTVEQLDNEIKQSDVSVITSLREAIIHEVYHAKTYDGKNKGQIDALYEQLEGLQILGISPTAMKDGFECIAESGVLLERGETNRIPDKAKELLRSILGVTI